MGVLMEFLRRYSPLTTDLRPSDWLDGAFVCCSLGSIGCCPHVPVPQLTPVSYSDSVSRLWTRQGYSMFGIKANKSDRGEALLGVFSMQERHIQ